MMIFYSIPLSVPYSVQNLKFLSKDYSTKIQNELTEIKKMVLDLFRHLENRNYLFLLLVSRN